MRMVLAIVGASLAGASAVLADDATVASDSQAFLTPAPTTSFAPAAPQGEKGKGMHLGDWMLFPNIFVGASYDSNVYSTQTNPVSDIGLRLTPAITAVDDNGVHKTTLYANGDFYFYKSNPNADVVNGHVGVEHRWEAERDLVFQLNADVSRLTDTSTIGTVVNGATLRPTFYESYVASATVQKDFGNMFVKVGGKFLNDSYENTQTLLGTTVSASGRDFNYFAGLARLGYRVSPLFYIYSETIGNVTPYYNNPRFNSSGFKTVVGVGSDRVSLFQGEVYAGYQQQSYQSTAINTVDGAVVGAALNWFPLEYLKVSGSADESFGVTTIAQTGAPNGTSTYITTGQLKADYTLSQLWTAEVRGGLAHTTYFNTPRVDNAWTAGASLNFNLRNNIFLTVDNSFTDQISNFAGASYIRNISSVGLTYKY